MNIPTRSLLLMMLVALLAAGSCMKDLRPGALGAVADPGSAARGRALLAEAVQAHGGLELWQKKSTTTTTLRDEWRGLAGRLANPWPSSIAEVTIHYLNGRMDSRALFRAGPEQGGALGRLSDGRTYSVNAAGRLVFTNDKDTRFILAALHYLNELPFRLMREAKHTTALEPIALTGDTYDRVLATWGPDLRPSARHDQYVLYINRRTKRVEKAHYTVRDFARFAEGCMHFDDYRTVEGLAFSFVQTVTTACDQPDYRNDFLHQVTISEVAYDRFDAERLKAPRP